MSNTLTLEIADVSNQKRIRKQNVQADASVGELVMETLPALHLPSRSAKGEPYTYHLRLEREGRHLNASERVGDVLQENDRVTLLPNIDAGRE